METEKRHSEKIPGNNTEDLMDEYEAQLTDMQKKAYLIARDHLKTTFNVELSNGFTEWKKHTSTR
jgi:hypothetical protein